MNTCLNCNQQTDNPRFCSLSCSAIHNNQNRKTGRKKLSHQCLGCDKQFVPHRRERRYTNCKYTVISSLTKGEALTPDTQRYRRIRSHAHHVAKKLGLLNSCRNCHWEYDHGHFCFNLPMCSKYFNTASSMSSYSS